MYKRQEKYNIERRYLEIEITESAFTSDEEQILKAVDELDVYKRQAV